MIEYGPMIESGMDYDTAWLFCLTFSHNNHKDWRMPTSLEYHKSSATFSWYDSRTINDYEIWLWYCMPVRDC